LRFFPARIRETADTDTSALAAMSARLAWRLLFDDWLCVGFDKVGNLRRERTRINPNQPDRYRIAGRSKSEKEPALPLAPSPKNRT